MKTQGQELLLRVSEVDGEMEHRPVIAAQTLENIINIIRNMQEEQITSTFWSGTGRPC